MPEFDFDAWRELAARDPEAYFRERERAIGAFISAHPEQAEMLTLLQAQIDQMRALSGTPINAAREIARLLGERLESLAEQLAVLRVKSDQIDRLLHPPRQ